MSSEVVPAGGPRLNRLFTWFDPESAGVSSALRQARRIPLFTRCLSNCGALSLHLSAGGHHPDGTVPGAAVGPAGLH